MIQIRLINFKAVIDRTYSIPDKGIILLDGVNGTGKTTLLEAISFTLYDNLGNSCYPRNGKPNKITAVNLEFPTGLTIYRQRRPNLLRVVNGTHTLIDDVAEKYIEQLYGPEVGWLASGYIQQLSVCRLLTMSRNEKLEFLQKMFLPDPEVYSRFLSKVTQLINTTQIALDSTVQSRQIKEGVYLNLYSRLTESEIGTPVWSSQELSKVQELVRQESDKSSEISQLEGQLILARAQTENNLKIQQELLIYQSQLRNLPETDSLLDKKKQLAESQLQLSLAKNIQRKNQLLIYRDNIQSKLRQIPDGTSKLTLTDLVRMRDIWSGPSSEDLEIESSQIRQALTYQEIYPKYQKYLAISDQLKQLPDDPAKLDDVLNVLTSSLPISIEVERLTKQIDGLPTSFSSDELNLVCQQVETLTLTDYQHQQDLKLQKERDKLLVQLKNLPDSQTEDLLRIEEMIRSLSATQCPSCQTYLYYHNGQLYQTQPVKEDLETLISSKTQIQEAIRLKNILSQVRVQNISSVQDELAACLVKKKTLENIQTGYNQYTQLQYQIDRLKKSLTITLTSSEIQENINKIKLRMSQQSQRRTLLTQLALYPSSCPEPGPLVNNPNLNSRLSQIETCLANRKKYSLIDFDAEEKIIRQTEERKQYQTQLDQIDREISTCPSEESASSESIEARINELLTEISELEKIVLEKNRLLTLITSLTNRLVPDPDPTLEDKLTLLKTRQEKYLSDQKMIKLQEQLICLTQLYQEHSSLYEAEKQLSSRLSCLTNIRSTIITAEYVIMDSVLERINSYLEMILGEFFTSPIRVTLRSLKKAKTSEKIRPEINIEVEYNGCCLTEPQKLSGGEYTRVSMALTLALAKVSNYPFILLDESMSATDVTNKERIIETLQTFFPDKLIITVNHDTNEGAYTQTIRF